MDSFSLGWIEHLCIWLIVVCAVVPIINRLLMPFLTGMIRIPLVAQIINIVLWCVVTYVLLYFFAYWVMEV